MRFCLLLIAAALTGCTLGIQPGRDYSFVEFDVDAGYQESYRRADAYPRACLLDWQVAGTLYTDTRSGVVHVAMNPMSRGDLLRIEINEEESGTSRVRITAADVGVFDEHQLRSAKASLETGKIVCRNLP